MTPHADPSWYWPMFWLVWFGAMAPAVYFLVTWVRRTVRPFTMSAVDATGWVAALVLAYVRSAFVVLVSDVHPPETGAAIGAIVIGGIIAALAWLRAVNWRRMRRGD